MITSSVACAAALALTVSCTSRPPTGGGPTPTNPPVTTPDGGQPPSGGSFQKGPNPTAASAGAAQGSFAITRSSASGSGFAGGNIYAPNQAGSYGAIVMAPPFMINSMATDPMAQRLASQGFVVLNFNANSTMDQPSQRATQMKAAIQALLRSPVASKVDANRIAVSGYSMGGGACLEVARDTPTLKAAICMVPWNIQTNYSSMKVPTAIIGGSADAVAGTAQHANPMYASIPASTPKLIAEVSGQSHFIPSTPTASFSRYAVSWAKVWVDGDTRYSPFLKEKASDLADFRTSGF